MKKQNRKWGYRWISLIGGVVVLSCNCMRSPWVPSIDQCYGAERAVYVDQETQKDVLLRIVNEERIRLGLTKLVKDEKLTSAAMVRAYEQQRLFSHMRPDGTPFYSVFSQFEIERTVRGENLAKVQQGSPDQVVRAWLCSSSHRDNLLRDQFVKAGIGYVQDDGIGYWCLLFSN